MSSARPNLNPNLNLSCSGLSKIKNKIKIKEGARSAFTLIELMVVVGIMGIILMISIPGIYRHMHPNPLQKAVDDIREACKAARELAVLRGTTTALAIDLNSKTFSVQGASAPGGETRTVPYDQPDYAGAGVVLVLGSEGAGLRPRVAGACDELVSLPMHGRVASLGVSAAASALLYEILQARGGGS